MSTTYDLSTDIGKIRLLITDTDISNATFTDEEISVFLGLTINDDGNDIYYAAAEALDTMARSEVLTQKRIKLLDLQTDGPAVAAELRKQAERLRQKSDAETTIDWAEMGLTNANKSEIIWNDFMRENG